MTDPPRPAANRREVIKKETKPCLATTVREKLKAEGWKLSQTFLYAEDLRKVRFEHTTKRQAEKGRPEKTFRWEHRIGWKMVLR